MAGGWRGWVERNHAHPCRHRRRLAHHRVFLPSSRWGLSSIPWIWRRGPRKGGGCRPNPARAVVVVDEGGAVLGMVKMNRRHLGDAAHIACAGRVVDPAPEGRGGSGLVRVHVGVGVHGRLWDQAVQCGGADQYACGGGVRIALFRGAGHVAGRVRPLPCTAMSVCTSCIGDRDRCRWWKGLESEVTEGLIVVS